MTPRKKMVRTVVIIAMLYVILFVVAMIPMIRVEETNEDGPLHAIVWVLFALYAAPIETSIALTYLWDSPLISSPLGVASLFIFGLFGMLWGILYVLIRKACREFRATTQQAQ